VIGEFLVWDSGLGRVGGDCGLLAGLAVWNKVCGFRERYMFGLRIYWMEGDKL
jgi:hypothetical protein